MNQGVDNWSQNKIETRFQNRFKTFTIFIFIYF